MNKTRRNFLNAGAIIAMVAAVAFSLLAIMAIVFAPLITTENLCEIYENDKEHYVTVYKDAPDNTEIDYFYEIDTPNQKITVQELDTLSTAARSFLRCVGWAILASEIASLVCAIFVIRDANRASNRKGFIIALLVLSLYTGNMLTFAFMVVGLCLKNYPPIEIVTENTVQ